MESRRYADDFIVTGESPEFLREEVLFPHIREFILNVDCSCPKKRRLSPTSKMDLTSWVERNNPENTTENSLSNPQSIVNFSAEKGARKRQEQQSTKQDSDSPAQPGYPWRRSITSDLLCPLSIQQKSTIRFIIVSGNGQARAEKSEQTADCRRNIGTASALGTGLLPQKRSAPRRTVSNPTLPLERQRTPKNHPLRKSSLTQIPSMSGGAAIMKNVMVRKC